MGLIKSTLSILLIVGGFYLIYHIVDEYFLAGEVLPIPLTNQPNSAKLAPDLKALDLHGNLVELKQFSNQVVIVNFWASWCPPCLKEFPSLIRLVNQFNGKVILLAVSDDETKKAAQSFVSNHLLSSPYMKVLWDKDFLPSKLFNVNKLPETFIFKVGGVFAKKISGYQNWDDPKTYQYIESLLQRN